MVTSTHLDQRLATHMYRCVNSASCSQTQSQIAGTMSPASLRQISVHDDDDQKNMPKRPVMYSVLK